MVFSATLGVIKALGVLFDGLWVVLEGPVMVFSATLGARYRLSGAIQWSLSGTRGSCGGLQCHMRGFKGSGSAIQWSLSRNILYKDMRGYIWLYGCYSMVSKWYYQGHGVVSVSHED